MDVNVLFKVVYNMHLLLAHMASFAV